MIRHHQRARLCVLDGIDGAGKSTLSYLLAKKLRRHGLNVVLTRQPTDLPSGVSVRRIARTTQSSGSLARALLQDRRAQHYAILRPAFQRTDVIICDRYFYSAVYQSKNIRQLHSQIAIYRRLLPIPDITFLLVPSAMEARRRIKTSKRRLDIFEQKMHIYLKLYWSLRRYQETIFLSKNLPIGALIELCVSKIRTKCGAF